MISIDTNVLVRLLTVDDKTQAEKARRLFTEEHIYITKTVMLETEWILRYAYELKADAVADAFTKLLGQAAVTVEDAYHVARSITLLRHGMDFADALYLVCSQNCAFATFDKQLKAKAVAADLETVRLL